MGPRAEGDKQGDLWVLAAPGEGAGGGDGAVADGLSLPPPLALRRFPPPSSCPSTLSAGFLLVPTPGQFFPHFTQPLGGLIHSQDHRSHVCAPTPNTYPSADFSAELTPYPNLPSPSLHLRDPQEGQLQCEAQTGPLFISPKPALPPVSSSPSTVPPSTHLPELKT